MFLPKLKPAIPERSSLAQRSARVFYTTIQNVSAWKFGLLWDDGEIVAFIDAFF